MTVAAQHLSHRDRQILCGLFLSKFDQKALKYLGFEGFTEAFNTLGYSLQAKPASIKNYRDELDPSFPNGRMGWHMGSGMSLGDYSAVSIEIGTYDSDKANGVISRVCRRMKCRDFEMVWD